MQDGGSSDLSGQSFLPSQYSSNRTHSPVDLHMNSDMRQHSVSRTVQINRTAVSPLITVVGVLIVVILLPFSAAGAEDAQADYLTTDDGPDAVIVDDAAVGWKSWCLQKKIRTLTHPPGRFSAALLQNLNI